MTFLRSLLVSGCVAAACALVGCGGGGSSDDDTPVTVDPPPANGSYAGTYACMSPGKSSDDSLVVTAVLPTATGAFSSCSGTGAFGTVTIACTGTIATGGALAISGTDSHNNTVTLTGQATANLATGTYRITPASLSGTFRCTH